ncbi:uncharacterized protein LOC5505111 isoform X2 [Nematostella vectensis]|uniref:uncharacterized protein LOC5505111 isoform X2 n=1 Tax=Nematostella vectensis TaxID=45351 RepID=UPI0013903629|nr:uncharacterized protein LOC5505111 isoform X2 [Nematostella vectensis]
MCRCFWVRKQPGAVFAQLTRERIDFACEDSSVEIFCSYGTGIKVLRAQYGRELRESALCQDNTKKITECSLMDVTDIIKGMCTDLKRCSVPVNNAVLGDLCPGVYKYFKLIYECKILPAFLSTTSKDITTAIRVISSRSEQHHEATRANTQESKKILPTTTPTPYVPTTPRDMITTKHANRSSTEPPEVHRMKTEDPNIYDREVFQPRNSANSFGRDLFSMYQVGLVGITVFFFDLLSKSAWWIL